MATILDNVALEFHPPSKHTYEHKCYAYSLGVSWSHGVVFQNQLPIPYRIQLRFCFYLGMVWPTDQEMTDIEKMLFTIPRGRGSPTMQGQRRKYQRWSQKDEGKAWAKDLWFSWEGMGEAG